MSNNQACSTSIGKRSVDLSYPADFQGSIVGQCRRKGRIVSPKVDEPVVDDWSCNGNIVADSEQTIRFYFQTIGRRQRSGIQVEGFRPTGTITENDPANCSTTAEADGIATGQIDVNGVAGSRYGTARPVGSGVPVASRRVGPGNGAGQCGGGQTNEQTEQEQQSGKSNR